MPAYAFAVLTKLSQKSIKTFAISYRSTGVRSTGIVVYCPVRQIKNKRLTLETLEAQRQHLLLYLCASSVFA